MELTLITEGFLEEVRFLLSFFLFFLMAVDFGSFRTVRMHLALEGPASSRDEVSAEEQAQVVRPGWGKGLGSWSCEVNLGLGSLTCPCAFLDD